MAVHSALSPLALLAPVLMSSVNPILAIAIQDYSALS